MLGKRLERVKGSFAPAAGTDKAFEADDGGFNSFRGLQVRAKHLIRRGKRDALTHKFKGLAQ